jgi:hypothetical protein
VSASFCDLQTDASERMTIRSGMHVYPVPADGVVIVEGIREGPCRFTVLDTGGRVVEARSGAGAQTTRFLDLQHLPGGTYLLVVEQEGKRDHRVIMLSGR